LKRLRQAREIIHFIQIQKCRLNRTGIFATKLKTENKLKLNSLCMTEGIGKPFKKFFGNKKYFGLDAWILGCRPMELVHG
jgi:hypothetical protein